MAASESFKQALQAGDITKALKLALSEAIELKITTWVASDTGPDLGARDSEGAQPGHRMQTRINIVDGDIDNEVGSLFLQQGPYSELQGFHQQQARDGRAIIHQNLTNVQQVISLWAKAIHRDMAGFAPEESVSVDEGDRIVEIPEDDISTIPVSRPAGGDDLDSLNVVSPPSVPEEAPEVIVEDIPETDEADMEDLLFGSDDPIEDWAEELEPPLDVHELAEDEIEEDVDLDRAPEVGFEADLGSADLDDLAMDELAEESPPETVGEEDFDVSAFDEVAEAPADSDDWGNEDLNLDGLTDAEGGLEPLAGDEEDAIAEAPEEESNVDEFPDFTDQLEAQLNGDDADDAWGSMPEEFREPTPITPPVTEDIGEETDSNPWGEIADDVPATIDEEVTDLSDASGVDNLALDDLSLDEPDTEEPSESPPAVDFNFEQIEVLSDNGNADDPLGLQEDDWGDAMEDVVEDVGEESTPLFESEPPGNAWSDADDEGIANEVADLDGLSLEGEESSEESTSWEEALFSNDNGGTDPLSALNDSEDEESAWAEAGLGEDDEAQAATEPESEKKPLNALEALFDREESTLDAPEEFSTQKQGDPLATLFGETPPDSLKEFLSDADAAISDESLLDNEDTNPFADFPDSSDFDVEEHLGDADRWFDDDADNNSMPEFAPPSDRQ